VTGYELNTLSQSCITL